MTPEKGMTFWQPQIPQFSDLSSCQGVDENRPCDKLKSNNDGELTLPWVGV